METQWIYYQQNGPDALSGSQHAHDDAYEILWVLRGSGSILVGDALYRMEANRIYFIPALMLHYTHPADSEEYVRRKLWLPRTFMKKILYTAGCLSVLEHLANGFWSADCNSSDIILKLEKLFLELESLYSRNIPINDLSCLGLMLQTLSLLIDICSPGKNEERQTNDLINNVLSFINANLGTPLTLDEIAAKCHISKYHLCHQFRQELNMTIMQYITEQRILLAKTALLESDQTISAIAMENGFMNFSHFCSTFRRSEGISPTVFRKKHRSAGEYPAAR